MMFCFNLSCVTLTTNPIILLCNTILKYVCYSHLFFYTYFPFLGCPALLIHATTKQPLVFDQTKYNNDETQVALYSVWIITVDPGGSKVLGMIHWNLQMTAVSMLANSSCDGEVAGWDCGRRNWTNGHRCSVVASVLFGRFEFFFLNLGQV